MEVIQNTRTTEHVFTDDNHLNIAFGKFIQLRETKELCDIILIANDEKKIYAHRAVLSANSPYFLGMFGHFKENSEKEIKLEWINSRILSLILDYMYTLRVTITESDVQDLYEASNVLQLTNLRQICLKYIKRQIDVENCLGIVAFAELYDCKDLLTFTRRFIEHHFADIVGNEEFLNLTENRLTELLSNDHLTVKSEEIVLESILLWINFDLENRKKYFKNLIKNVRFNLLNPEYVNKFISENSILKNMKIYEDNSDLYAFKNEFESLLCRKTLRQPIDLPYVLAVVAVKTEVSLEFYDFEEGIWYRGCDMNKSRYMGNCIVFDDELYVAGGHHTNTVEVYKAEKNQWKIVTNMQDERTGLGLAVLNNCLLAIGGSDWNNNLKTVDQFDFNTREWSYLPPMLWKADLVGTAVLNNRLYVVGGTADNVYLKSAQCYDPITREWSVLPDMGEERSGPATCVFNGKLYVCGGYSAWRNNTFIVLTSVEYYDPETNSWAYAANMNICRGKGMPVVYKDIMYVIGGHNDNEKLDSIEMYDAKNNVWLIAPFSISSPVYGHSAALLEKSVLNSLNLLKT